ncbi:MAG: type III-A CRISPR-associated RAMP protein Csm5 [Clostridiaceae bacterium]|nr:type III-A CRISPR-associated RAMP protein Csm5 [Clostridiaceae bacterium]
MKFILETLTPVSIGSGEVLSQFTDYVYDNDYVYYLDHDLLINELTQKENSEELLDEFVKTVYDQAKLNTRKRFNLKDFLIKHDIDYKTCCSKKIPVQDEIKEQIQLHIKAGSRPYIPGSSLKGAIRTALLAFLFEKPGVANNKREYIGGDIFGMFSNDVLKYLLVSDTISLQNDCLRISKFYRYNLKDGKTNIPVVKEVINRGSTFKFSIKVNANKGEISDKFNFLQKDKEEQLLGIMNEYSKKNIEIQLHLLQKNNTYETNKIKELYSNLLTIVEKAEPYREAYIRVGSGKTFYDNTVAQKLSKAELTQIIKNNYKKADAGFFPKTLTIIKDSAGIEVPGWVRITRLDN